MATEKSVRFRIGDVFPADDPVAAWLVTMSQSCNDVVSANVEFAELPDDAPAWKRPQKFGIAAMYLWETVKHLDEAPKRFPEIKAFLDGLPAEALAAYANLQTIRTGAATPAGKHPLEHLRNSLVAHYNEMHPDKWKSGNDPIRSALEDLADEETVMHVGETVAELRFDYADEVRAKGFFQLVPTEEEQRALLEELAAAVGDVATFVQHALDVWMMAREDALTIVE